MGYFQVKLFKYHSVKTKDYIKTIRKVKSVKLRFCRAKLTYLQLRLEWICQIKLITL